MNEEELKKEIDDLKKDLKDSDSYYINLAIKYQKQKEEIEKLTQRLKDIKEGFEGCCYACEPVGMLNQELEAQLKCIEEDGTEEHNAAIELRNKLVGSRLETDEWKKVARQLYGAVLHLQEVTKNSAVVVVGPGFYSEIVEAVKEYENLQND